MLTRIIMLRVTFVLCALMQDQCGLTTDECQIVFRLNLTLKILMIILESFLNIVHPFLNANKLSLYGLHPMEFGPAIQRTRLARSYKSIQMNEEKTIHPERMVMRTIRNITGGFLYGINRPEDGYLRAYDYCVQWAQRDSQTKEIFGPSFKWTVEKFNLSLPCSKCVPNEAEVSWQFISPEDVEENLQVWRRSRRLELRDLKQSNTGHYVCKWRYNDILAVGSVTTVEIIQSDDLHVVNWKNYKQYQQTELEWENLRIFTQWTEWSACNKCNRTGKRHKFGNCMVQLVESARQSSWDALSSYADRIVSCKMLLNLYPEMEAENETLSKYLEQPPKIMLAYCKVGCNQKTALNDKEFEKLPSEIRELYLHGTFSSDQDSVFLSFIPDITETTVAEILCVAFLLFLQAYIIYHVCKYRQRKALKRAKELHRDNENNLNNANVKNVAVQYEKLLITQSSETGFDTDDLTEES